MDKSHQTLAICYSGNKPHNVIISNPAKRDVDLSKITCPICRIVGKMK